MAYLSLALSVKHSELAIPLFKGQFTKITKDK